MSKGYGQYCPLALAVEILCQRWTVLVISRLMDGCTQFNDIHRGLPRMSPSLLSKRLAELEEAGLVRRRRSKAAAGHRYELTDCGRDLTDVVNQLAIWGQHWGRDMTSDDLDPAFLAWSMHLRMDTDSMPSGQVVLEFLLTGGRADGDRFWLVKRDDGSMQMCLRDPGLETDLLVTADLKKFIEAWRGFRDLRREIRSGRVRLAGPAALKKAFPDWLLLSSLAQYQRLRPGREQRLSR